MRKTCPYLKTVLLTCALVFLLGGCAAMSRWFGEEEEKTPEQLMTEAVEHMEKGRYEAAAEAFRKVKDRYPYSKFAVEAELKTADALFRQELYPEALDDYAEFERLHPKNRHIPYVIFQKGMCHFLQVSTVDRDQTHSRLAREEFERLVKRFPRDLHARKARLKIRQCIINLAEYELYVARFYMKSGHFRAAVGRFRHLLETYPDLGQYREALKSMGVCLRKLAEAQEKS